MSEQNTKSQNGLNKNIVALGVNSFFTDVATEMILPLLPIFLDRFLHATKGEIGIIEGVAEFGVAILIALSGFVSDRLGKRKLITTIGYTLSNLIKPLAFFASSSLMIALIRVGDRVGKGVRAAPRDALISAYTQKSKSGFVFGFHKMMDSAGAVLGSLVAFFTLWQLGDSESSFRTVFAISLIPGILSMMVLIFFVSDVTFIPAPTKKFRPSALPKQFYTLVFFQTIFSLVAMNYSFMILKASEVGMALIVTVLAYTLYNFCISIFAIPIGKLADKVGKATLLSIMYGAFGVSAALLASGSQTMVWAAFIAYGFFAGGFNSLSKAIISDTTPTELKATAYGVYYTCVGFATLLSLAIGGYTWDRFGGQWLFVVASLFSFALSFLMLASRRYFTIDAKLL